MRVTSSPEGRPGPDQSRVVWLIVTQGTREVRVGQWEEILEN